MFPDPIKNYCKDVILQSEDFVKIQNAYVLNIDRWHYVCMVHAHVIVYLFVCLDDY